VINEVMTDNDSAWLDDADEVEDWIELANLSNGPVQLQDFALQDDRGRSFQLPERTLPAGGLVVLFADDDTSQGPLHVPWKLSAQGVTLELIDARGVVPVDRVQVPALSVNQAYARFGAVFSACRYASPERANGASCEAPEPPQLSDRSWPPYSFPEAWQKSRGPLAITELALRPASFIELRNISSAAVDLSGYQLRVAAIAPAQEWPDAQSGVGLGVMDARELPAGEALQIPITATQLDEDPLFEGVLTLFDRAGAAIERVDFMHWPEGASLVRVNPARRGFRFCEQPVAGTGNPCKPLMQRPVGGRLRHLYTPGDYAALAEGDSSTALRGVKFVVDMQAGDSVFLLSSRSYPLHYTFIREQIDRQPTLDRCDTQQASEFLQAWIAFSEREYFRPDGRRFLLGTLASYAGSDAGAVDFAVGDQISGVQMRHAFFAVLAHLDVETPARWAIHPTEPRQEVALETVQGQVADHGRKRAVSWPALAATDCGRRVRAADVHCRRRASARGPRSRHYRGDRCSA
jgi:hypothetical protein